MDLGWILDKLQRLTSGQSVADDLPGLSCARALDVFHRQVTSAVAGFGTDLALEDLPGNLDRLRQAVAVLPAEPQRADHADHPACAAVGEAVDALHLSLIAALSAANYKFGKAYLLGHGLASLYRADNDARNARDRLHEFVPDRIEPLLRHLADLHGVLPHNVAGTIALSLQLTADHLRRDSADHPDHHRRHHRDPHHFECAELRLQGTAGGRCSPASPR